MKATGWRQPEQYDAEGNLTLVDGGQTASYIYDGLNRRIQTTEGGSIVEYFYDLNGRRTSTWNGTTNAQIEGQSYWGFMPVEFYSGGSSHFQHQDWEGTERMRTASNGAVEGTYQSLPFGDGFTASGSDSDAYHFAMLDHSYDTDTDHAQFRQYENIAGGPMLGVPLPVGAPPGLQWPFNVALAPAIGAATTTSVTTLAGETVIGDSLAFPLAAAKFAIDAATFATGYFVCQP